VSKVKPSPIELTPQEIFDRLDAFVIGQKRAKRTIAVAAYNHIKRISNPTLRSSKIVKKSNVLMVGPTGCGKTHIAKNLAEIVELPFTAVDATEYTEAGYYGKDVEVMIGELLHKTGGNAELAEMGIVFIDEIDKVARKGDTAKTGAGNRDIGGEGVQQSLLRMLEGRKMFIPQNVTQHWNKHDFVEVDTSNILFICAGTFSDLRDKKKSNIIGINSGKAKAYSRKINHEKLSKHGIIPELLGRLPVIVEMEELTADELLRVLKEPPDSLVRQYKEMMSADNIKLTFENSALKAVVDLAIKRKLGARGLRGIMEDVMHDFLFDAPKMRGKSLAVTQKDVIKIADG